MGSPRNEGEGNKTADRNYREATTEFVQSERGKREIENAGKESPEQEREGVTRAGEGHPLRGGASETPRQGARPRRNDWS